MRRLALAVTMLLAFAAPIQAQTPEGTERTKTGSPSPTILRAPSGTLTLGPLEFREYCLEMKARDEIQYDFLLDRPIEFNIHYHEGIKIHLPITLEGTTAHSGEFVAESDQAICLMWHNKGLTRPTLTYRVVGP